jgi:hypothetical protein
MAVGEDPKFRKYFKLKKMKMSIDQIKMKMEVDGVDPELLDKPFLVSPNDLGVSVHLQLSFLSLGVGSLAYAHSPSATFR